MAKLYRCENAACTLGSRSEPGHFTGGISAEQAHLLTGDPEALHGEGVCPNCGVKGKAAGTFTPDEGSDPYAALHAQIAARVADESDPLTGDEAQAALHELVEKEG